MNGLVLRQSDGSIPMTVVTRIDSTCNDDLDCALYDTVALKQYGSASEHAEEHAKGIPTKITKAFLKCSVISKTLLNTSTRM